MESNQGRLFEERHKNTGTSSNTGGETAQNIEKKAIFLKSADNLTYLINRGTINLPNSVNTFDAGKNNTVIVHNHPWQSTRPERVEFNIEASVSTFTARKEFITGIHQDIFHTQKTTPPPVRSRSLVIYGIGGVGKTQAVRKYIDTYKISYDHVLWIYAESYDDAIDCFIRLAQKLSMDVNSNGKRKADKDILAEIYDYVCRKFSLIVYDNVESSKSEGDKPGIQQLLPQAIAFGWKVPAIIVTTRYRDWPNYTLKELTGFDLSESLTFLAALEFEETEDNRQLLEEIANMCQGLPLALKQVISFFRIKRDLRAALDEEPYTLKDFLTDVTTKKRKKFVSTPPSESAYPAVYKIFDMTFEQIGLMKNGKLALNCIDIMAILNPDFIPTILIKQFFNLQANKLAKALILLHKYTLVTRCGTYYQIHRMVQAVKIESNKQNGSSYVKQNFNTMLESLTPFLNKLQTNCENVHEILNNSKRLHDQAEDPNSEKLLEFQDILVRQLKNVGNYRTAIELQRKNYQSKYQLWGPEHPITIRSKFRLSTVLQVQGHCTEAEELYNGVLKMQINVLGTDHPDTLNTKNNLAAVYDAQGKYDKAEELYNEVLKMQINVLGTDHPNTLNTKNNLALVYDAQGKYDEAEELYNEVLKMQIDALGPDHPDTINTKNNIALVYHQQGKYDKAEQLYNDVLKLQINVLGAYHPDTLNTINNLAAVYDAQGKYDKAEELYNDVLKMRINVVGATHPDTLNTKNSLALTYHQQGKYDKAEQLYNDVLKMQINVLGTDHTDTLSTKNNLAEVFRAQGKYDEAEELYNDVLKMRINVLGADHPDTQLKIILLQLTMHRANMTRQKSFTTTF